MSRSDKLQATDIENTEYHFSDTKTRSKIVKHLSDINDTISDEDISNVITDISSGGLEDKIQVNRNTSTGEDAIIPDEESSQMPSSWNIIE